MINANEKRIFQFVKGYIVSNGEAPTIREIGDRVGLNSSSSVHAALASLEREGLIKRAANKHRGIELVQHELTPMNELMIAGREG